MMNKRMDKAVKKNIESIKTEVTTFVAVDGAVDSVFALRRLMKVIKKPENDKSN